MADSLKDIFPNDEGAIDRETLIRYLNGSLPPEEMHKIESILLESEFLNDAVEGLQDTDAGKKLPAIEKELKSGLEKLLKKRDERRMRKTIKELPWIYIVIIVIILLIIISYAVIKSFL